MATASRIPNIHNSKLTHSEKVIFEKNDVIVLTGGKTAFDEPFYVYVQVGKDAFEQMKKDFAEQNIVTIYDYGDVIKFGPGAYPPQDVKDWIEKTHGKVKKKSWLH